MPAPQQSYDMLAKVILHGKPRSFLSFLLDRRGATLTSIVGWSSVGRRCWEEEAVQGCLAVALARCNQPP
ncbi:BQ5605_C038g11720 [Microbotryum silenes-dioicae]|uniref:BQ5605_C038g11720 protein n=1 Tax=Microbotryum silenes-dioicae TaxID=796604 RepID=A0A2X0N8J1_9BASI|nr:BQ5605_C038g11720 [Microbotryum silenes-dioicae]